MSPRNPPRWPSRPLTHPGLHDPSELGSVGLLKKRLSTFRQRGGQNDAGGSSAAAAVTDDRFCMRPQVGSKVGFLNSPSVPPFQEEE